MADQVVLVEKTEGVAILTLNRPEQLNAMNGQLSAELREAVARMSDDDEVGCIVITGAGRRAFAGGDIHEQREDDRRYTQAELDARNAVRARGSYEIGACPKPTIGMMNGLPLRRGRRAGVVARHARGLRAFELPVPGRRATGGSTAPGPCPTRSAGPSPRSYCSRPGSSKRRKPSGSGSSITSSRARSSATRRCGWRR